jgi:WD40 repeat protein
VNLIVNIMVCVPWTPLDSRTRRTFEQIRSRPMVRAVASRFPAAAPVRELALLEARAPPPTAAIGAANSATFLETVDTKWRRWKRRKGGIAAEKNTGAWVAAVRLNGVVLCGSGSDYSGAGSPKPKTSGIEPGDLKDSGSEDDSEVQEAPSVHITRLETALSPGTGFLSFVRISLSDGSSVRAGDGDCEGSGDVSDVDLGDDILVRVGGSQQENRKKVRGVVRVKTCPAPQSHLDVENAVLCTRARTILEAGLDEPTVAAFTPSAAFSSPAGVLFSANRDLHRWEYNVVSGVVKHCTRVELDGFGVSVMVPLRDGERVLFSSASDNRIWLMNVRTREELWKIDEPALALAVSPDECFFARDEGDQVALCNLADGSLLRLFDGKMPDSQHPSCLDVSPGTPADAALCVVGSEHGLKVWDCESSTCLRSISDSDAGEVLSVCFDGAGTTVFSGYQGCVIVRDALSGKELSKLSVSNGNGFEVFRVTALSCSPDSSMLLVGCRESCQVVLLYDVSKPRNPVLIQHLWIGSRELFSVGFDPSGRCAVVATDPHRVLLFDIDSALSQQSKQILSRRLDAIIGLQRSPTLDGTLQTLDGTFRFPRALAALRLPALTDGMKLDFSSEVVSACVTCALCDRSLVANTFKPTVNVSRRLRALQAGIVEGSREALFALVELLGSPIHDRDGRPSETTPLHHYAREEATRLDLTWPLLNIVKSGVGPQALAASQALFALALLEPCRESMANSESIDILVDALMDFKHSAHSFATRTLSRIYFYSLEFSELALATFHSELLRRARDEDLAFDERELAVWVMVGIQKGAQRVAPGIADLARDLLLREDIPVPLRAAALKLCYGVVQKLPMELWSEDFCRTLMKLIADSAEYTDTMMSPISMRDWSATIINQFSIDDDLELEIVRLGLPRIAKRCLRSWKIDEHLYTMANLLGNTCFSPTNHQTMIDEGVHVAFCELATGSHATERVLRTAMRGLQRLAMQDSIKEELIRAGVMELSAEVAACEFETEDGGTADKDPGTLASIVISSLMEVEANLPENEHRRSWGKVTVKPSPADHKYPRHKTEEMSQADRIREAVMLFAAADLGARLGSARLFFEGQREFRKALSPETVVAVLQRASNPQTRAEEVLAREALRECAGYARKDQLSGKHFDDLKGVPLLADIFRESVQPGTFLELEMTEDSFPRVAAPANDAVGEFTLHVVEGAAIADPAVGETPRRATIHLFRPLMEAAGGHLADLARLQWGAERESLQTTVELDFPLDVFEKLMKVVNGEEPEVSVSDSMWLTCERVSNYWGLEPSGLEPGVFDALWRRCVAQVQEAEHTDPMQTWILATNAGNAAVQRRAERRLGESLSEADTEMVEIEHQIELLRKRREALAARHKEIAAVLEAGNVSLEDSTAAKRPVGNILPIEGNRGNNSRLPPCAMCHRIMSHVGQDESSWECSFQLVAGRGDGILDSVPAPCPGVSQNRDRMTCSGRCEYDLCSVCSRRVAFNFWRRDAAEREAYIRSGPRNAPDSSDSEDSG